MPDVNQHPVRDVIERLDSLGDHETVTLQNMLDAFATTSFIPALIVPALLVVSPLSGIPLFSTFCGLTIALVAAQMIVSRNSLWLPSFLMRRTVAGHRLHAAMGRMQRLANGLDRISRDRLRFLVTTPGNRIPYIMALIAGASMPLLELVPFSSSILGMCVLSCAIGLLARDGLFVLAGTVFLAIAAAIPFTIVSTLSLS